MGKIGERDGILRFALGDNGGLWAEVCHLRLNGLHVPARGQAVIPSCRLRESRDSERLIAGHVQASRWWRASKIEAMLQFLTIGTLTREALSTVIPPK